MARKKPVNSIDHIREFWDECHNSENVTRLTGSQYEPTIESLKLGGRIQSGTTVLEVGVGMGYVTQDLHEVGAKVSAIDISKIALERVAKYCEATYIVEDMKKIPSDYFDVIICSSMVQHVHTELLRKELESFIRSLTSDGVLALQFVSNRDQSDMGVEATVAAVRSGTLCRSPEFMESLIDELGGECELVVDVRGLRGRIVNGSHVFHVRKAKGKAVEKGNSPGLEAQKPPGEDPASEKPAEDDVLENPSAQIRSPFGYNNPYDY